ncbi:MAG: ATP-dependent helicase HrpB, partial [Proteobacteria bacterium]|nr:ATP-dependent helicase HrpB [Pseudomonadota bacterium]
DEFHERHLQTDTALNALRNLQLTRRPELRIVVMSATLSTESLSRFLSSPSEFNFVGEPHPLSIEYLNAPSQKPLEIQVRDAGT